MESSLHPDTNGQRMMAEAIEPTLARLMHDTPQQALTSMTDINTAVIPVERLEPDVYDWYARHHGVLDLIKHVQPRVVLIGDSITHFWGGIPNGTTVNGAQAWERVFRGMPVINMGFGWDRTQNVLWRLRQGEFDGLHPQWVVLAIGTNNLTGTEHARASTPQEIVEGIDTICKEIGLRSPETHIILMAIFRAARSPATLCGLPFSRPITFWPTTSQKIPASLFSTSASSSWHRMALYPRSCFPTVLTPPKPDINFGETRSSKLG